MTIQVGYKDDEGCTVGITGIGKAGHGIGSIDATIDQRNIGFAPGGSEFALTGLAGKEGFVDLGFGNLHAGLHALDDDGETFLVTAAGDGDLKECTYTAS